MYLLTLIGNPNFSSDTIKKALVTAYGKNFFKKFPIAAKELDKESKILSNGMHVVLPFSENGWERLGKMNLAIINRGKTLPFRITSGEKFSGDMVGEVNLSFEHLNRRYIGNDNMFFIEAFSGGKSILSGRITCEDHPETLWDICESFPLFWKIALYQKLQGFKEEYKAVSFDDFVNEHEGLWCEEDGND